jgi:hypothetical protein
MKKILLIIALASLTIPHYTKSGPREDAAVIKAACFGVPFYALGGYLIYKLKKEGDGPYGINTMTYGMPAMFLGLLGAAVHALAYSSLMTPANK